MLEDITIHDIFECFNLGSPKYLFDRKLRTKKDLLAIICFCIDITQVFSEVIDTIEEEDDI